MSSEQSLLEQISEKEEELKRANDLICKQSEDIISKARKQATRILETAEQEGKRDADIVFEEHMKALSEDIVSIREKGSREAEKVREQGEKNLPRAVSKIISAVTG